MPGSARAVDPSGNTIIFEEVGHRYYTPSATGEIPYTSCTSFIHGFCKPFPADMMAARCAAKEGVTAEEIKRRWDAKREASCVLGTRIHETIEDVLRGNPFRNQANDANEAVLMEAAKKAASKVVATMSDIKPEQIVFDLPLRLAGTADCLAKDKKGQFWILDWKGLALDTPIWTEKGWRQMGELKPGDILRDGMWHKTRIRNVSAIHHNPCFAVVFSSGETIVADNEHRWETYTAPGSGFPPRVVTTLSMKAAIASGTRIFVRSHTYFTFVEVVEVEQVETVPTRCIEVDSPLHTYCAGNYFCVTHNTNAKIDVMSKYGNKMLAPVSHLDDCNFNTYSLQLSLYEFMLKHRGYIPSDLPVRRAIVHFSPEGYVIMPTPDRALEIRDMLLDELVKKGATI